jgi:hypothetical protein
MILAGARNWASWYERPFVMGHVEHVLSLIIPTKILQFAVLESF